MARTRANRGGRTGGGRGNGRGGGRGDGAEGNPPDLTTVIGQALNAFMPDLVAQVAVALANQGGALGGAVNGQDGDGSTGRCWKC